MSQLTLEEQENILLVAQGLLDEPGSFVKGAWKCDLHAKDPNDKRRVLKDEKGNPVQATDSNGQPLYRYCIHGAVNQAAITVLNPARLAEFGVTEEMPLNTITHKVNFVDKLGLDGVARELYQMEAMQYNDSKGRGRKDGVLNILRTGLERVRAKA